MNQLTFLCRNTGRAKGHVSLKWSLLRNIFTQVDDEKINVSLEGFEPDVVLKGRVHHRVWYPSYNRTGLPCHSTLLVPATRARDLELTISSIWGKAGLMYGHVFCLFAIKIDGAP